MIDRQPVKFLDNKEAALSLTTALRACEAPAHPLRVARAIRGFSQRELEQLAGLPATTLSRVENGERRLDPAQQRRVAMALEIDDVGVLFPPV